MAGHTAGPWEVHPDFPRTIRASAGQNVASTAKSVPGLPTAPHGAEREANARLIAAAPKLLEALKECTERLAASQPPEGGITASVVANARDVIAEAEKSNC